MFQTNPSALLKKMFFSFLLGTFLFANCMIKFDSVNFNNSNLNDSITQSKIFIIKGTVVSGLDKINSTEFNDIKSKTNQSISKISIKKTLHRSHQNKDKDLEIEKYSREIVEDKICTVSKDADEKYHSLVSGRLKVISGNQYKYNFVITHNHDVIIFLPYQAIIIKRRHDSINTLSKIEYWLIRPPPISLCS